MLEKESYSSEIFSDPSLSKWAGIILFALLVYFPVFLHLEKPVFRVWDESRIASNTIEMSENGDLLIPHYNGEPDLWNTKPPLLIWSQLIFYKIFGYGELAFRLPSGLAALFTCLGIIFFSLRYLKSYWFGMIAILLLITSEGYIGFHVVRTGDYDSMLTMFMFLYSVSFFMFIRSGDRKFWYSFLFLMVLAVLTKGVQGLLFLPGLATYIILRYKEFKDSFRFVFLTFTGGLIIASAYYLIREYVHPGYLEIVWNNELGGRYLQTLEGHRHNFWYYYYNFINYRFEHWYWIIAVGMFMGFMSRSQKIREVTIFSTIVAITYWLIISFSKTKLEWYDAPMYPMMSMISAIGIYQVFNLIRESKIMHIFHQKLILHYIFIFILFYFPYEEIVSRFYWHKENQWNERFYTLSYTLKKSIEAPDGLYAYKLLYDRHGAHLDLYLREINSVCGQMKHKDYNNLAVGDSVILNQQHIYEFIDKKYNSEIIERSGNVYRMRILNNKTNQKH
jgi:4-amino-4-deoxy-L-arabinose transferase-like glycosyltransferase